MTTTALDAYDAIIDDLRRKLHTDKRSRVQKAHIICDSIYNRLEKLGRVSVFFLGRGYVWSGQKDGHTLGGVAGVPANGVPANEEAVTVGKMKGVCAQVAADGKTRNIGDVSKSKEYYGVIRDTQSQLTFALFDEQKDDDNGQKAGALLHMESPELHRFPNEVEAGCARVSAFLQDWQDKYGSIFPPPPSDDKPLPENNSSLASALEDEENEGRQVAADTAVYVGVEEGSRDDLLSPAFISGVEKIALELPEKHRKQWLEKALQTAVEICNPQAATGTSPVRPTPPIFQNLPEGLARPYSKEPLPDEVLTPENISTAYRIQNAKKRKKPEAALVDPADVYMAGRIIRAHEGKTQPPALG